MDDMSVVLGYALLGLAFLLAALFLLRYLRREVLNPAGKGAEKRTRGVLRRFAGIRRFRVLGELELSVKGKSARIESLLIGFFGVLMVHTLGARGEYYGTLDGPEWHVVLDKQKTSFPNPVLGQQRAEAVLRSVFAANKLYNIPIEHIVYLESKSKKTGLFITNSGEILLPGKLRDYLQKTKFEVDAGLDVEKVAKAILDNH